MTNIKTIYGLSLKILKKNPVVILPFALLTVIQTLSLVFLYLIPRAPLKQIFGPMVKVKWGEMFLHYPNNFLLLPKLNYLANMALIVLVGSFLTATAVALVSSIHYKQNNKIANAFKKAVKHYISLFIIVFVFSSLFFFSTRLIGSALVKYFGSGHSKLLFLGAGLWLNPILKTLNFIIALVIQSAFIYAIPVLLIENRHVLKAIKSSFLYFKKWFLLTLVLVGLPMLLYIPLNIIIENSALLINKFFPEIVLIILIFNTAVSCLIVDLLMTITTTVCYLNNREEKGGK